MPLFLRCLAVAISLTWVSAPSATAEPFRQDRFALGMWVPPQTKDDLEFRYRELAEANFNLVIGNSPVPVTEQLRVCDQLGLKTLVHVPGAVENWPTNASCWGYLLRDEPGVADFPGLAQSVADLRRLRPGRLAYVNLFPNYANAGQLGATNYEEHVARFLADVKPEVLSMDHYPLMRPTADRRGAYCENLETFRRHSVAAGVPFWNFFHAMPFADRMDPTEAQIRWQIYAAVAYGAKGVLYFCYWTPGKGNAGTGEFPKGGALLTAEGRRTRHYDEAKRINAELKNLGPTLMQLTGEGVRRVHTGREPARALANSPVLNLQSVQGDPHAEFLVGSFRHADGRRAVLLVNHDHAFTAWPTVTFDAAPNTVREVDKATGAEAPLTDDSPELPGVQLSFGAGDGRLFLLPAAR
jgi:hypothetical protein